MASCKSSFILALFMSALMCLSSIDASEAARHLLQTTTITPPAPLTLPGIPHLPKTVLPPIPSLPQPSLPNPTVLPPLPNIPTIPKVNLPPLPSIPTAPTVPTIPTIPFLSPPPAATNP
ncbi:hypothetical protein I3760_05G031800 [Carya illinoinensis]|uniref:Uncharacterized protein n=1 Tax=Carya illinoinensis TaxID=32201 RepID=A0A8T1QE05_CARIL|nr:hypothetical protein I3760_05G031800 [Carya illinoinensis]KAG6652786.1 hypothetical protein CIPAW_05G030400 [Carya illinoinensis]KAG6711011.1 hypothetical protein I3842_05G031900 [Carya illinoinensis]